LQNALKLDVSQVYVGIGGQSVRSIKNKVERNLMTQTYITAEHIDSMRDESRRIPFADYELIENYPQSYMVDGRVVDEPVGVIGTKLEGDYLNVIARRTLRSNIESCFSNTDVKIAEIRLAAYELADKVLTDQEKRAGCALVNLGAGTTTVVVYKNNVIRHLVTLPIGSSNITQDLMSKDIDENEANSVKLQYGNACVETSDEDAVNELMTKSYKTTDGRTLKLSEIQTIVEARLTEIIANVKNQIFSSVYANQLLGGVVLTGGGAAMRNIDKAFTEQLKVDKVRVATTVNMPVVKNSNVANFLPDNVASTSILSLLVAGDMNCVGEKISGDPDMFGAAKKEQEVAERREQEQKAAQQENEALTKLEDYKTRMRDFILKLGQKVTDVREDDSNKRLRENAAMMMNDASDLLDDDYEQQITLLEGKDKYRLTIREARDLEEKLNDARIKLSGTIDAARKKNSLGAKVKGWLEDMVNGDN
jgi:cell division protein FtsA